MAALQLAGEVEYQGLAQAAVGAYPGQGVQLLPVGGEILAVLVVGIGQRLQAPPHLLALVALGGGLGELGGGVHLDQVLNVVRQFLGAHLQHLHGLEHLRGQFQGLFQ